MSNATDTETNPYRDQFKDLDANGLALLLKELPRWIVGDGKSPNVFFVTNQTTGNVVAVFMGDEHEDEAIRFADSCDEPLMVEDRLTGVVHDNPAGEALQDRLRDAEEGHHFEICPNCDSSNIANEGPVNEHGQLHVTCHNCSFQWVEENHETENDDAE
jgi:predicted RNA-binding Zn-ribbon protein involved in translation (DUF1610 family)